MKRFPFLLLLLLLPLTASAQKDNFWTDWNNYLDYRAAKRYAELDSNYVGRYPYRWDARVFYNTDGLHLSTSGTDSDVRLATGMANTVGIGLSFRGVGLNYSVALGKKRNFDFGFASYGKRLGFEYSLRVSSRLSGEVSWFGLPRQQAERGDLTLMASNLTVLYNFNPRFSYAAAMKQNAIQRKSAGSFLLAASWTGWDVLGAGPDIISKQTSLQTLLEVTNMLYLRYSIGAGYGYNLVLGQEHWLLHASVIPMWTFYDTTIRRVNGVAKYYHRPLGPFSITGTARAGIYYRWGTRWTIGLNGVVNQMASSTSLRRSQEGYQRFDAQDWQARLSVGYRF